MLFFQKARNGPKLAYNLRASVAVEDVVNGNFRVGPWLVEPSLNTLSQNGTSVRLEPKQIEVLVCLARHQGETVSKENLLQTVWPDTFVGDDVLVRCIFVLRRLFEDDPKKPDFIQTIARRGYRLVAPVVWENEGGTARGNSGRQTSELRKTTTLGRALRYGLGLAGAVLVLGLSFLSNLGGIRTWLLPEKAPSIRFLAVLPLQNLSGDPAQDYFADGMTEELITELSRISSLRVISRTSVMRYKGTKKSLPEIAHELGADGIVEGSVLRSGNQVRITAQLIYAQQDTNVWAETYDRDLGNVLALQSEIANNIASAVKIESTPQEKELLKNAHSVNVKALEAYLQGEYSFKRMGAGEGITGYRSAISFFKQAIADDPNFAPAYVGLAQTYDGDFDWRPDEKMPLEKAATAKALELDAGLAEAHLMNASIKINYDFDLPGGEREIKAALRLNPNLAEAHEALASYLSFVR